MPKLLEKRPEPPALSDILEDLNDSSSDDVVFNFFAANAKSSNVIEVGADQTKGSEIIKNNAEHTKVRKKRSAGKEVKPSEESTEVDECYNNVKTLIESYNYLKTSQTSLTEKCSELEEMGQKVQQQITELKGHLTQ